LEPPAELNADAQGQHPDILTLILLNVSIIRTREGRGMRWSHLRELNADAQGQHPDILTLILLIVSIIRTREGRGITLEPPAGVEC
jgi:hypothetical protein